MRPILLLGHDEDETFGSAPAGLEAGGCAVLPHLPGTGEPLPALTDVAGVITFGGAMNIDQTDAYPFLAEERAYTRAAVDAGVPYLGICLGAQMLARAMDRTVYPVGARHLGFGPLHL